MRWNGNGNAETNQQHSLLKGEIILVDEEAKRLVEKTFEEVARHRKWNIETVKALSDHVHVLVEAPQETPEKVTSDLKAWGTRRLREAGIIAQTQEVWAYHGSTRYLNDPQSIESVRYYIDHCQEDDNEPRA